MFAHLPQFRPFWGTKFVQIGQYTLEMIQTVNITDEKWYCSGSATYSCYKWHFPQYSHTEPHLKAPLHTCLYAYYIFLPHTWHKFHWAASLAENHSQTPQTCNRKLNTDCVTYVTLDGNTCCITSQQVLSFVPQPRNITHETESCQYQDTNYLK